MKKYCLLFLILLIANCIAVEAQENSYTITKYVGDVKKSDNGNWKSIPLKSPVLLKNSDFLDVSNEFGIMPSNGKKTYIATKGMWYVSQILSGEAAKKQHDSGPGPKVITVQRSNAINPDSISFEFITTNVSDTIIHGNDSLLSIIMTNHYSSVKDTLYAYVYLITDSGPIYMSDYMEDKYCVLLPGKTDCFNLIVPQLIPSESEFVCIACSKERKPEVQVSSDITKERFLILLSSYFDIVTKTIALDNNYEK